MKRCKVPTEIMAALEATGLPFDFEQGGHHLKIRLGRHMVGVMPMHGSGSTNDKRPIRNIVSQIRRCAAGLTP